MMRALVSFIILAVLTSLASLLANMQGGVNINLGGYSITTSLAGLTGAVMGVLMSVLALVWLLHSLWQMPDTIRRKRSEQQKEAGEAALADALMALARGDAQAAENATGLARQKLPDRALPLLMSAQAALLDGRPEWAEENYRAMLGAAATAAQRVLGLEGLYYMAQRRGDVEAAGTHALRVLELAPKTVWALDGLMALAVRIGDWDAAQAWLRRWGRAGVTRQAVKRRRAVLALAQAQSLMATGDPADQRQALQKAEQAGKYDAGFVPAIAMTARLLAAEGQLNKAKRLLRQAWAREPHRELADAWLACMADQPAAGWMRAASTLLGNRKDAVESRILRARIALKTQKWRLTLSLLTPLTEPEEAPNGEDVADRYVYALLAEAAQGVDDEAARLMWQERARHAPPEAGWMTSGLRLTDWQAICPVTGQLDGVRWQQAEDDYAPHMALMASRSDLAQSNMTQSNMTQSDGAMTARLGVDTTSS